MTMLQESPITRGEKLPAGEIIHARLVELSKATEEEFASVPFESGIMAGQEFTDHIAVRGLIGQRIGIIGTARKSFESVDSDTGETYIIPTEDAIRNLEDKYLLDSANEDRYSLARGLIDSICDAELQRSAAQAGQLQ